MMKNRIALFTGAAAFAVIAASSALAHAEANQCDPSWMATFGDSSGLIGRVEALAVFDDGSGPALYVGGSFTPGGGGWDGSNILKWDGEQWSHLDSGINGTIYALTVFDDGSGSGPALYAGGVFGTVGGVYSQGVAKWDGNEWSGLAGGVSGGKGGWVEALTVYDDGSGSGPALYAGGYFEEAGGVVASSIAKWDGTAWSPLGSGMTGFFPIVSTLMAYDSGTGPELYVGGTFNGAGGVTANRIARWNGTSWSPVGGGTNGDVLVMKVFENDPTSDGTSVLYAGGVFTTAGGVTVNRIAKWDGTAWSALGSGMNSQVRALAVFDEGTGSGPALYAGGGFTTAGGVSVNRIAKWDGATWSPLGSGPIDDRVFDMIEFNANPGSSDGPALYVGGHFTVSPAGDTYLAKWQGCPVEQKCDTGDLNCDGVINVSDLLILLANWGPCADQNSCPEDLNDDGIVNVSDLLILLANWG